MFRVSRLVKLDLEVARHLEMGDQAIAAVGNLVGELDAAESATRQLILLCVMPHCQQKGKGRETIPAVGKRPIVGSGCAMW